MAEKEKHSKVINQKESHGSGLQKILFIPVIVLILSVLFTQIVSEFEPEAFSLPPGPKFEGSLSINTKLQGAELLLKDRVKGPESLLIEGDTIYTTPEDGRLLKIINGKVAKEVILVKDKECQTSESRSKNSEKCGRPLGIRRLNKDLIICADAYLGIITIDVEKDKIETILKGDAMVDGKRIQFADDLDILDENTVIFSDASTKYRSRNVTYSHIESQPTGRIIQLNIKTKEAKVLLNGLYFPNGVQLFPDKQSVLVAETERDRLTRYYLSGPKKGQSEIFVAKLPGSPDNIRLNSRGNFYVAMAFTKHPENLFLWDFLGPYPFVRKLILQLIPLSYIGEFHLSFVEKYGLVLEIDENGKIVSSLHDSTGVVRFISEVHEDDKYIYVASFRQPFIARIKK